MRQSIIYGVAAGALALAFALPAQATVTENYPGFGNTTGLTLAGNATTTTTGDGTVLQLASGGGQAGAAYSQSAITLGANSTFSTTFQFRLTNPGGIDPADGFTFVLAQGTSGLGSIGQGLGYQSVSNSVAVEFDLYNNGSNDGNSSNHVAVDINGHVTDGTSSSDQALSNVYGNPSCGFAGGTPAQNPYTAAGCMANGDLWTANISYNGNLLSVGLSDPSEANPFMAITNYSIDIGSIVNNGGQAFVGFTGATASGYITQDIVNWQFANDTSLGPAVPEPGSLSLLAVGLAGLGFAVRRRRAV